MGGRGVPSPTLGFDPDCQETRVRRRTGQPDVS
jgi:hypothetical protein